MLVVIEVLHDMHLAPLPVSRRSTNLTQVYSRASNPVEVFVDIRINATSLRYNAHIRARVQRAFETVLGFFEIAIGVEKDA